MLRSIMVMFSLIAALFLPFINGCDSDSEDEKDIAARVAEEWTAEDDQIITDEIIDSAIELFAGTTEIPGISELLSQEVLQQVIDNTTWTYSIPEETGDSKYEVVATATSNIDLQMVGSMELYVDLILDIDTEEEEVTNWRVDPESFDFKVQ